MRPSQSATPWHCHPSILPEWHRRRNGLRGLTSSVHINDLLTPRKRAGTIALSEGPDIGRKQGAL